MDLKLELVLIPVADVDRAKDFYVEKAGFTLDVDHRPSDDFRVVQMTTWILQERGRGKSGA